MRPDTLGATARLTTLPPPTDEQINALARSVASAENYSMPNNPSTVQGNLLKTFQEIAQRMVTASIPPATPKFLWSLAGDAIIGDMHNSGIFLSEFTSIFIPTIQLIQTTFALDQAAQKVLACLIRDLKNMLSLEEIKRKYPIEVDATKGPKKRGEPESDTTSKESKKVMGQRGSRIRKKQEATYFDKQNASQYQRELLERLAQDTQLCLNVGLRHPSSGHAVIIQITRQEDGLYTLVYLNTSDLHSPLAQAHAHTVANVARVYRDIPCENFAKTNFFANLYALEAKSAELINADECCFKAICLLGGKPATKEDPLFQVIRTQQKGGTCQARVIMAYLKLLCQQSGLDEARYKYIVYCCRYTVFILTVTDNALMAKENISHFVYRLSQQIIRLTQRLEHEKMMSPEQMALSKKMLMYAESLLKEDLCRQTLNTTKTKAIRPIKPSELKYFSLTTKMEGQIKERLKQLAFRPAPMLKTTSISQRRLTESQQVEAALLAANQRVDPTKTSRDEIKKYLTLQLQQIREDYAEFESCFELNIKELHNFFRDSNCSSAYYKKSDFFRLSKYIIIELLTLLDFNNHQSSHHLSKQEKTFFENIGFFLNLYTVLIACKKYLNSESIIVLGAYFLTEQWFRVKMSAENIELAEIYSKYGFGSQLLYQHLLSKDVFFRLHCPDVYGMYAIKKMLDAIEEFKPTYDLLSPDGDRADYPLEEAAGDSSNDALRLQFALAIYPVKKIDSLKALFNPQAKAKLKTPLIKQFRLLLISFVRIWMSDTASVSSADLTYASFIHEEWKERVKGQNTSVPGTALTLFATNLLKCPEEMRKHIHSTLEIGSVTKDALRVYHSGYADSNPEHIRQLLFVINTSTGRLYRLLDLCLSTVTTPFISIFNADLLNYLLDEIDSNTHTTYRAQLYSDPEAMLLIAQWLTQYLNIQIKHLKSANLIPLIILYSKIRQSLPQSYFDALDNILSKQQFLSYFVNYEEIDSVLRDLLPFIDDSIVSMNASRDVDIHSTLPYLQSVILLVFRMNLKSVHNVNVAEMNNTYTLLRSYFSQCTSLPFEQIQSLLMALMTYFVDLPTNELQWTGSYPVYKEISTQTEINFHTLQITTRHWNPTIEVKLKGRRLLSCSYDGRTYYQANSSFEDSNKQLNELTLWVTESSLQGPAPINIAFYRRTSDRFPILYSDGLALVPEQCSNAPLYFIDAEGKKTRYRLLSSDSRDPLFLQLKSSIQCEALIGYNEENNTYYYLLLTPDGSNNDDLRMLYNATTQTLCMMENHWVNCKGYEHVSAPYELPTKMRKHSLCFVNDSTYLIVFSLNPLTNLHKKPDEFMQTKWRCLRNSKLSDIYILIYDQLNNSFQAANIDSSIGFVFFAIFTQNPSLFHQSLHLLKSMASDLTDVHIEKIENYFFYICNLIDTYPYPGVYAAMLLHLLEAMYSILIHTTQLSNSTLPNVLERLGAGNPKAISRRRWDILKIYLEYHATIPQSLRLPKRILDMVTRTLSREILRLQEPRYLISAVLLQSIMKNLTECFSKPGSAIELFKTDVTSDMICTPDSICAAVGKLSSIKLDVYFARLLPAVNALLGNVQLRLSECKKKREEGVKALLIECQNVFAKLLSVPCSIATHLWSNPLSFDDSHWDKLLRLLPPISIDIENHHSFEELFRRFYDLSDDAKPLLKASTTCEDISAIILQLKDYLQRNKQTQHQIFQHIISLILCASDQPSTVMYLFANQLIPSMVSATQKTMTACIIQICPQLLVAHHQTVLELQYLYALKQWMTMGATQYALKIMKVGECFQNTISFNAFTQRLSPTKVEREWRLIAALGKAPTPQQTQDTEPDSLSDSSEPKLLVRGTGSGKSSMLIPRWLLGDERMIIMLPEPLLRSARNALHRIGILEGALLDICFQSYFQPTALQVALLGRICHILENSRQPIIISRDFLNLPIVFVYHLTQFSELAKGSRQNPKLKEIISILWLLSKILTSFSQSRVVIDEAHEMLKLTDSVRYSCGNPEPIDPIYFTACEPILKLLLADQSDLADYYFHQRAISVKDECNSLVKQLINCLCESTTIQLQFQNFSQTPLAPEFFTHVNNFLNSTMQSPGKNTQLLAEWYHSILNEPQRVFLKLLYKLVHHTLPDVRSMIYGKHFSRDSQQGRLPTPCNSMLEPDDGAHFDDPTLQVLLLAYMLIRSGMTQNELRDVMELMAKRPDHASLPAAVESYDALTAWKDDQQTKGLLPFPLIDPTDISQVTFFQKKFSKSPLLILHYILQILPRYLKNPPSYIESHPWELCGLPNLTLMTGTPDLLDHAFPVGFFNRSEDPQPLVQCSVLLQDFEKTALSSFSGSFDMATLLQFLVISGSVNTIIDASAYFASQENEKIARVILNHFTDCQYVVFYEASHPVVITRQGCRQQFSALVHNFREGILYLDAAHTVGVDFDLPPDAQAILLVNPENTQTEITQACGRLRLILSHEARQKIWFVLMGFHCESHAEFASLLQSNEHKQNQSLRTPSSRAKLMAAMRRFHSLLRLAEMLSKQDQSNSEALHLLSSPVMEEYVHQNDSCTGDFIHPIFEKGGDSSTADAIALIRQCMATGVATEALRKFGEMSIAEIIKGEVKKLERKGPFALVSHTRYLSCAVEVEKNRHHQQTTVHPSLTVLNPETVPQTPEAPITIQDVKEFLQRLSDADTETLLDTHVPVVFENLQKYCPGLFQSEVFVSSNLLLVATLTQANRNSLSALTPMSAEIMQVQLGGKAYFFILTLSEYAALHREQLDTADDAILLFHKLKIRSRLLSEKSYMTEKDKVLFGNLLIDLAVFDGDLATLKLLGDFLPRWFNERDTLLSIDELVKIFSQQAALRHQPIDARQLKIFLCEQSQRYVNVSDSHRGESNLSDDDEMECDNELEGRRGRMTPNPLFSFFGSANDESDDAIDLPDALNCG